MRPLCIYLAILAPVVGSPGAAGSGSDPVISEFMAINDSAFEDEDGEFTDWIEIYNPGVAAVDLGGWFLTDDASFLTKWRFPAVAIAPKRFLLVFASGKNRRDPAYQLHTNFKLMSTGEFLGLVRPDGATIASSFARFPAQFSDVPYGYSQDSRVIRLISSGAAGRAIIPANGGMGMAWTDPAFNDTGWLSGTTGVGFDRASDYRPLIGLDVGPQMDGVRCSAYIRIPFTVEDPSSISALTLRVKYDDGFVVYLNGQKVAWRNAPENPSWDAVATGLHDDSAALVFEDFTFYEEVESLKAGSNVLAIHGLNQSLGSSDFLILPELDAVEAGPLDTSTALYLSVPTPGWANAAGYAAVSEPPSFSHASGVYTSGFSVTLSAAPGRGVIRYTLDWTEPTASSPEYAGPLAIDATTMLRAKVFDPGAVPSATVTRGYTILDASVRDFSSDLPLVVVNTFGQPIGPDIYVGGYAEVFETEGGRARLTDPADHSGLVGVKQRGSSSAGFPKKMYALEIWDERGNDIDAAVLGLPAESDWVLYAPYSDKSLMRNVLAYGWSNDIDRYAVRTRFVEMFLKTDRGPLTWNDYVGVYVFMEKIKRGEDRVDIEKLLPSEDAEPEISGGYIMKIDRPDPGDVGFTTNRGTTILYVTPKESQITAPQRAWLKGYMDTFESALFGADFRDPQKGYARSIDVDSWVDHFLLTELCKNIDGYRLSTFFYKDRGGAVEMGPIWDYNLSLGNANYLNGWRTDLWYLDESSPTDWGKWWHRLFDDVDFEQRFIDRWTALRRGALATEKLMADVDANAAILEEAQVRNFERWPILGTYVWPNWYVAPTWQAELDWMKSWIRGRVTWIDSLYLKAPAFSREGGPIEPGFELTIAAPVGAIYYKIDGIDPRLPGGALSTSASVYSGPIHLYRNARVSARARYGNRWSGLVEETYYVDIPDLVVSEVMYHPANPPPESPYDDNDFEFIELLNRSDEPLDLTGVKFSDGIQFEFPEGTRLPGGACVVIAKDLDAFGTRYDTTDLYLLGDYSGNLENRGERIAMVGSLGEPIFDLTYDDAWHPETDGQGHSLESIDPWDPANRWSDPESWQPSLDPHGSPGVPSIDPSLGGRQRPGDANQDGRLDISDAVGLLRYLFSGVTVRLPCEGESLAEGGNLILLDVNGDGAVDLADPIYTLMYLFQNGPPPARGTSCIRIPGCSYACRR